MNSLLPADLLTSLGVLDWGYTEEAEAASYDRLITWTQNQHHGTLEYLNDHRKAIRQNLKLLYPDFESSLVFLFSYQATKKWMLENHRHQVAAYTLGFEGEDYHHALKSRLETIFNQLTTHYPTLEHFQVLDTQPVLERDLAYRAGLGWFGKNSMLISRKNGSYFIIGSLLLNQKLPLLSGAPDTDHCGQCTACAEACPTQAIDLDTRTLRAQNCISTFTIEVFKEAAPPDGYDQSRGEIFGCDICQDVCPWNNKPLQKVIADLKLKDAFAYLPDWLYQLPLSELAFKLTSMSGRALRRAFHGTAFARPGRAGWLKNLRPWIKPSQNDF